MTRRTRSPCDGLIQYVRGHSTGPWSDSQIRSINSVWTAPSGPIAVHERDRRQTRAKREVPLSEVFQLTDIVLALPGKGDSARRIKQKHEVRRGAGALSEFKIEPFAPWPTAVKREQRIVRVAVEQDETAPYAVVTTDDPASPHEPEAPDEVHARQQGSSASSSVPATSQGRWSWQETETSTRSDVARVDLPLPSGPSRATVNRCRGTGTPSS